MSKLFVFFFCTFALASGKSVIPNFYSSNQNSHPIYINNPSQVPQNTYNNFISNKQQERTNEFIQELKEANKEIPEIILKNGNVVQIQRPFVFKQREQPQTFKYVQQPSSVYDSAMRSLHPTFVPTQQKYVTRDNNKDYTFGYYGQPDSRMEQTDIYGNVVKSYKYVDAEGKLHIVKYTTGKDGFRVPASNIFDQEQQRMFPVNDVDDFNVMKSMLQTDKYRNVMKTYKYVDAEGKLHIVQYTIGKDGIKIHFSNILDQEQQHSMFPVNDVVDLTAIKSLEQTDKYGNVFKTHKYVDAEGKLHIVQYTIGKDGFRVHFSNILDQEQQHRMFPVNHFDDVKVIKSLEQTNKYENVLKTYKYVDAEGKLHIVQYTIGKDGFRIHSSNILDQEQHRMFPVNHFDDVTVIKSLEQTDKYGNVFKTHKYVDAEGKLHIVQYTIGKDGFRVHFSSVLDQEQQHRMFPVKDVADMTVTKSQLHLQDVQTMNDLSKRVDFNDQSSDIEYIKEKETLNPEFYYSTRTQTAPGIYSIPQVIRRPIAYSTVPFQAQQSYNQFFHNKKYPTGQISFKPFFNKMQFQTRQHLYNPFQQKLQYPTGQQSYNQILKNMQYPSRQQMYNPIYQTVQYPTGQQSYNQILKTIQ